MPARYRKPPITEAIIGIRLAQPLEKLEIESIQAEFHNSHPNSEERLNVVFKAQPGASSVIEQSDGFNLRNTDALRSLVVGAREFSSTCLAPYPGWNVFFADAISNYRRFRHVLGYRQLDRVGVRFINRIDIPHVHPTQEIMLSDYFTISPDNLTINTANPDLKYSEYFISMHINYDLPIRVMLQTGLTPSALVDHRAVMLDIDASVMGAAMVPQNEAALEELLTRLRTAKNDIFERSITNTTRQLFEPEST